MAAVWREDIVGRYQTVCFKKRLRVETGSETWNAYPFSNCDLDGTGICDCRLRDGPCLYVYAHHLLLR
jgi:hypothetical protein